MRITFLGHACFVLETASTRLLTDPYSSEIGYDAVRESADIVTLSHDNPKWHSALDEVRGEYKVYRGLENLFEPAQVGEVRLEAIEVFEVLPNEGPNAMVKITDSSGLRVLHLGDLGHLPTNEHIAACGEVDVMLVLAGGYPTIALDELMLFLEKLSPKIVIPMHYAVPHLAMKALPVEALAEMWAPEFVIRHANSTLEITPGQLPERMQLHILKPLRARV